MRFLKLNFGIILSAALLAPAGLVAHRELPSCITSGFDAGGPIIIGEIISAQLDLNKGSPSVTVAIKQYIRGPRIDRDIVDVMVDWKPGANAPYGKRPPIWYSVRPEVKKRVLIMFWKDGTRLFSPVCVLDMDSPDRAAVPVLERMVALSESPADQKVHAMQTALSDPEVAVRHLAVNYLTSPPIRDPQIRLMVFQHFEPIALDTSSPLRLEAIEVIISAYDGFSTDSAVNDEILSFVANRMTDSDPMMRSVAVQYFHSRFFGGGSNKPDLSRVQIADRAAIIRQLRQDVASDQEFADQAKRVLGLLAPD
jgi:hypothetical protein